MHPPRTRCKTALQPPVRPNGWGCRTSRQYVPDSATLERTNLSVLIRPQVCPWIWVRFRYRPQMRWLMEACCRRASQPDCAPDWHCPRWTHCR